MAGRERKHLVEGQDIVRLRIRPYYSAGSNKEDKVEGKMNYYRKRETRWYDVEETRIGRKLED
jgi:hypothetical protein